MQYYYEAKPDTQNYHYISHKTGPFVALHFHSAIELLLVRRGRMLAVINGEELVIEEGNGCFVNSFCMHAYSEIEKNTEVYAFVGNSSAFEAIFSDIGGVPPTKFKFDDFDLLDQIITYYNRTEQDSIRYTIFRGASALVLSAIAFENTVIPVTAVDRPTEICSILRYISEHYTENLTLNALAERFGYAPPYFSRIFHRYMKINLTEYINVARVNRAKRMLDESRERSVADVAFECGFSSLPSFYRTYRKVFGKEHPKR